MRVDHEAVASNVLELLYLPIRPTDFDRTRMIRSAQSEIQTWILRRKIPARRNHILDHSQAIRLDDDARAVGVSNPCCKFQSGRDGDPVVYRNGSAQHEYGQETVIYRNRGDGRFGNVSETAGPHFREKHVGRGGAGFD